MMHAPDYAEPVQAWRAWRIDGDGTLRSVAWDRTWPAREVAVAGCAFGSRHVAPAGHCSCGWYGLSDPTPLWTGGDVVGRAYLWGRIVVHAAGYRAEYAYPAALILRPRHDRATRRALARAAERYGVPLCTLRVSPGRLPAPAPVVRDGGR